MSQFYLMIEREIYMLKRLGKRLKDQRGLTLVELLAVILILGIIAAIAVPSIGNIVAKSKYDAAKADAIQVINSAKLYVASNGVPDTTTDTDLTSDDGTPPTELSEFIEKVNNLSAYVVTITKTGEIKIKSSTAISANKKGEVDKIVGTISDINALTYEGI